MTQENCKTNPTFPKHPSDGQKVCDLNGNVWEYNSDSNNWLSKGVVSTSESVTEETDGFVTPEIYKILKKLSTYTNTAKTLKLLPGTDAYWYYFRSSDKLFRFRREGPSTLRIEVDKGRLYQILMKQICPGSRGQTGDRGPKGKTGKPAPPEICYAPTTIDESRIDFAIFTPTPLMEDTDEIPLPNNHIPEISVRIFITDREVTEATSQKLSQVDYVNSWLNDNNIKIEKFDALRGEIIKKNMGVAAQDVCDIELSPVTVYLNDIDVDPVVTIEVDPLGKADTTISHTIDIDEEKTLDSVKYDPSTGIVCGSVYLINNVAWLDLTNDICIKSRQKGPDGDQGFPGERRIRITHVPMDNSSVRATCPIVHARFDEQSNSIYTMCANLVQEVTTEFVRLSPGSNNLTNNASNAMKSTFASASMTTDSSKRVNAFKVTLADDDVPQLNLKHWSPQPGIVTKRHYNKHKFDWVSLTDIPACDNRGTWFGPSETRPGKYPYEIALQHSPDQDVCCQDDFFLCPNLQDTPYG